MEKELRDMLRNKADDIVIDTDVPRKTLKRSNTRRAMTATLAGVVGVAVLVGRVLRIAGAVPDEQRAGPRAGRHGRPAAGPWTGLWPQDNRADAEAAQAQADAGTDFEWQTDPGEVLRRYGVEIRMWETTHFVDPRINFSVSPIIATIGSCAQQSSEAQGGSCEFAQVSLEQLLGTGPGKLWFVTEDVPGDPGPGDEEPRSRASRPSEEFTIAWMDRADGRFRGARGHT